MEPPIPGGNDVIVQSGGKKQRKRSKKSITQKRKRIRKKMKGGFGPIGISNRIRTHIWKFIFGKYKCIDFSGQPYVSSDVIHQNV